MGNLCWRRDERVAGVFQDLEKGKGLLKQVAEVKVGA